jgi:FlaA1/EpsC-like NDP-sugar epimerase
MKSSSRPIPSASSARRIPGAGLASPTAAPFCQEVPTTDLLGRRPAPIDIVACEQVLKDRTVLITGGCGSVGAELGRHVLTYCPERLVLLDNNESGLFDLEIELGPRAGTCSLITIVANITDEHRIARIFDEYRPHTVFHAAAYKHVPLMERFPEEAVKVNVFGTLSLVQSALRANCDRFVLVSTDKAVEPISAMGMTKRLAELLVLNAGHAPDAPRGAESSQLPPFYTAVRFGNVLGSRGSVVPVFLKQIEMGGPVTVTHPAMTRYFMDIAEAAHLTTHAASLTHGGDIFVLEMGQCIRIDDLARTMIRQRGLRPDIDIPIVYVGMREGEKIHEKLTYSAEDRQCTSHPAIYRVVGDNRIPPSEMEDTLGYLARQSENGNRTEMLGALRSVIRALPDSAQSCLSHSQG